MCLCACMCVCVQSSDCQCCTTVQVEQCRVISDTEGQRWWWRKGRGEVVKETELEKGKKGGRERGEEAWCRRETGRTGEETVNTDEKSGGSREFLQVNF